MASLIKMYTAWEKRKKNLNINFGSLKWAKSACSREKCYVWHQLLVSLIDRGFINIFVFYHGNHMCGDDNSCIIFFIVLLLFSHCITLLIDCPFRIWNIGNFLGWVWIRNIEITPQFELSAVMTWRLCRKIYFRVIYWICN